MRTLRIKQRFLDMIVAGQKTLEVRVAYESIKRIKVGEKICFVSQSSIVVQIISVRRYKNFIEMLNAENADRILPGSNQDNLLFLLRQIYSTDRENLGVVILDIQCVN